MKKFHIGGVTPFTTVDYPGKLSCVFYFQGCIFRCPYCHNKEFQEIKEPNYTFDRFADFLEERKGLLDAVVFSGGEPILFVEEVEKLASFLKDNGFLVGIHTTGYSPENLERLLTANLIDWVGIDLKAHSDFYPEASGVKKNFFTETTKSIELLKKYSIDFEVRTTIYRQLANEENLKKLFKEYQKLKITSPIIQIFSQNGISDEKIKFFVERFVFEKKINAIIRS